MVLLQWRKKRQKLLLLPRNKDRNLLHSRPKKLEENTSPIHSSPQHTATAKKSAHRHSKNEKPKSLYSTSPRRSHCQPRSPTGNQRRREKKNGKNLKPRKKAADKSLGTSFEHEEKYRNSRRKPSTSSKPWETGAINAELQSRTAAAEGSRSLPRSLGAPRTGERGSGRRRRKPYDGR